MSMESLKAMEEQLISCVQGQLGDISRVDTHELGEAIDMIKDLAEAKYYCTITEAMEKTEKKDSGGGNVVNYYTAPSYDYNRNMERNNGYMYYPMSNNMPYYYGGDGGSGMGGNSGGMSHYTEMPRDMMRDPREGRSAIRRRMYMEGKEQHRDTNSQLKELEAYLQELSTDITEMIKDASPEERATLRQKMTTLASKIG